MQVLDIELTAFTRRSRSVVVDHSATSLSRGLQPAERILVRDADGELYSAVVAAVDYSLADTHYRLTIGGRVPAGVDAVPVAVPRPRTSSYSVEEVVALLGSAGPVPWAPRPRRSY